MLQLHTSDQELPTKVRLILEIWQYLKFNSNLPIWRYLKFNSNLQIWRYLKFNSNLPGPSIHIPFRLRCCQWVKAQTERRPYLPAVSDWVAGWSNNSAGVLHCCYWGTASRSPQGHSLVTSALQTQHKIMEIFTCCPLPNFNTMLPIILNAAFNPYHDEIIFLGNVKK